MDFLQNVNWESVLITSIPGMLILAGILYNGFRTKKNAEISTNSAVAVKREPTWVELEESNRKLRAEMADMEKANDEKLAAQKVAFDAKYDRLASRFDNFETRTNTRIGALSNMLHASASQWPPEHPGPYFDPKDLGALESTDVPFIWRNRVRPSGS